MGPGLSRRNKNKFCADRPGGFPQAAVQYGCRCHVRRSGAGTEKHKAMFPQTDNVVIYMLFACTAAVRQQPPVRPVVVALLLSIGC